MTDQGQLDQRAIDRIRSLVSHASHGGGEGCGRIFGWDGHYKYFRIYVLLYEFKNFENVCNNFVNNLKLNL